MWFGRTTRVSNDRINRRWARATHPENNKIYILICAWASSRASPIRRIPPRDWSTREEKREAGFGPIVYHSRRVSQRTPCGMKRVKATLSTPFCSSASPRVFQPILRSIKKLYGQRCFRIMKNRSPLQRNRIAPLSNRTATIQQLAEAPRRGNDLIFLSVYRRSTGSSLSTVTFSQLSERVLRLRSKKRRNSRVTTKDFVLRRLKEFDSDGTRRTTCQTRSEEFVPTERVYAVPSTICSIP